MVVGIFHVYDYWISLFSWIMESHWVEGGVKTLDFVFQREGES